MVVLAGALPEDERGGHEGRGEPDGVRGEQPAPDDPPGGGAAMRDGAASTEGRVGKQRLCVHVFNLGSEVPARQTRTATLVVGRGTIRWAGWVYALVGGCVFGPAATGPACSLMRLLHIRSRSSICARLTTSSRPNSS